MKTLKFKSSTLNLRSRSPLILKGTLYPALQKTEGVLSSPKQLPLALELRRRCPNAPARLGIEVEV